MKIYRAFELPPDEVVELAKKYIGNSTIPNKGQWKYVSKTTVTNEHWVLILDEEAHCFRRYAEDWKYDGTISVDRFEEWLTARMRLLYKAGEPEEPVKPKFEDGGLSEEYEEEEDLIDEDEGNDESGEEWKRG